VRWRTIQIVLESGYVDGFRQLSPDPGWTFPTWNPHIRLDYVFVATRFAAGLTTCGVIDGEAARAASDHFPLLAVLA
jgi:exodeoxyribonuclease-3